MNRLIINKKQALLSVFLFLFSMLSVSQSCLADSVYDILRKYGPPQEKIEYEPLRKELWIYPEREILIKEGVLVEEKLKTQGVVLEVETSLLQEESPVSVKAEQGSSSVSESEKQEEAVPVYEILTAIEKAGAGAKGSTGSARPGTPVRR